PAAPIQRGRRPRPQNRNHDHETACREPGKAGPDGRRARAETERHIAIIERQIEKRAERIAISANVKTRQFGRGTSRWGRADERDYQEAIAALRFERRNEID